jgi:hypothetical protein
MPKPRGGPLLTIRQRQFKAALVLSGQTLGQWCDRHTLSVSHVQFVLRGRKSQRVNDLIDDFVLAYGLAPSTGTERR